MRALCVGEELRLTTGACLLKFGYIDRCIWTIYHSEVIAIIKPDVLIFCNSQRFLIEEVSFCSSLPPPGGTLFGGWHTDIQTTEFPVFYHFPSHGQSQFVYTGLKH